MQVMTMTKYSNGMSQVNRTPLLSQLDSRFRKTGTMLLLITSTISSELLMLALLLRLLTASLQTAG